MTRDADINTFLAKNGWAGAQRCKLAGDASKRSYERLQGGNQARAILMNAPPETGEDITPFLNIAAHLQTLNLAPPQIFAHDAKRGFILMEDFGDDLFYNIFQTNPDQELKLYRAALGALAPLHAAPPPPNATHYGPAQMAQAAQLAQIWYAGNAAKIDIQTPVLAALNALDWSKPVLVLRDYHAQNLIWRAGEKGHQAVGLLDFQDAQIGHPLYDAISLIFDARRDLPPDVRDTLLNDLENLTPDRDECRRAIATLNAQRNLRILGVFARLCLRDGKADYVDLIPRVWQHLQHNLQHPCLTHLQNTLQALPPPTPEFLQELKEKCGTYQTV